MFLGSVDFKQLFVSLNGVDYPTLEAAKAASAPVIAYGNLVNTVIQFLIIAFVIFLMVRRINRLKGPAPVPADDARRLSVLPLADSEEGDALLALHIGRAGRVIRPAR